MAAKYAIGITINGNEVRAAFLGLVRGKARIKKLESTTLEEALEQSNVQGKAVPASLNDLENAFDIQEPDFKEEAQGELNGRAEQDNNVSKIYALIEKFQVSKANVAINSPHLTVKYDYLNPNQAKEGKKRKNPFKDRLEDLWGSEDDDELRHTKLISIHGDMTLKVDYEYHPPILDLIEEVNQFRSSNLNLVLMDTNELALVELVKEIYKFNKDEVTAIVYIEEDFSRVIFLKGKEIYHISPIVHKGSMSADVLEVIYSRMIFAQDHSNIPEIHKVLVAGHSSRLKAKHFFRQKFPSATTGYLNSKKIESDLRFKDRGLLFSRYAVPIALAWKALIKPAYQSREHNLLPEYILERQTLPKLAAHGYALLLLVTLTAFAFTWALVAKNIEIRRVESNIVNMNRQIDNNKALTNRVQSFDDRIIELETKVALVDSFSASYTGTLDFLLVLNKEIKRAGGIWLTDLSKSGTKVTIKGAATKRDRIPLLATALGSANLKKVTRSQYRGKRTFTFHMEKELEQGAESRSNNLRSAMEAITGKSATNGTNGSNR